MGSPSLHGQYSRRPVEKNVPTFSKDVAPIIFKNCAGCHRPGEIAPMSLLTYEEARPWAKAIRDEVGDRHMPPWHADAPAGTFHNERLLSDADRATLIAWANGGAPKGDPAALPPTPTFPEGWSAGKPDVVLEMTEAYKLPADGTIEYRVLLHPDELHRAEVGEVDRDSPGQPRGRAPRARLLPGEAGHRADAGAEAEREELGHAQPSHAGQEPAPHGSPGPAAAADRVVRARHHRAGCARGHGVQARAGRHLRTADALHDQRRGNERSHEDRHHVLERAVAARASRRPVHQRRLHAAGRQSRRRRDRGRRVPAGHDRVGPAAAHAPARQEVGLQADPAGRRDEDHPVGAELRLQLADLLHVQGAVARAEGREDRLDRVVRQLCRATSRIPIRRRT